MDIFINVTVFQGNWYPTIAHGRDKEKNVNKNKKKLIFYCLESDLKWLWFIFNWKMSKQGATEQY